MKAKIIAFIILVLLIVIFVAVLIGLEPAKKSAPTKEAPIDNQKNELIKEAEKIVNESKEDKKFYDFVYIINPNISIKDYNNLKDSIEKYNKETRLTNIEFLAVCAHESLLVRKASSPSNDYGICQINLGTARFLNGKPVDIKHLYEIDFNIMLASKLMKLNLAEIDKIFPDETEGFKKLVLISSYNMGVFRSVNLAKRGQLTSVYNEKVMKTLIRGTKI